MKSERELLQENLERFRTARSYKQPKFQKLNEVGNRDDYFNRKRRQAVGNWNKSVGQYVMQHSEEIEQATKDDNLPGYVRDTMIPALGDEAKTYLEGILQEPQNRNSRILQQRLWNVALAGEGLGTKGIFYSSSRYQKENKEAARQRIVEARVFQKLNEDLLNERSVFNILDGTNANSKPGLKTLLEKILKIFKLRVDFDGFEEEFVIRNGKPNEGFIRFEQEIPDSEDELGTLPAFVKYSFTGNWYSDGIYYFVGEDEYEDYNAESICVGHGKPNISDESIKYLLHLIDSGVPYTVHYGEMNEGCNLGVRGKHPIKDPAKRQPKFQKLNENSDSVSDTEKSKIVDDLQKSLEEIAFSEEYPDWDYDALLNGDYDYESDPEDNYSTGKVPDLENWEPNICIEVDGVSPYGPNPMYIHLVTDSRYENGLYIAFSDWNNSDSDFEYDSVFRVTGKDFDNPKINWSELKDALDLINKGEWEYSNEELV